MASPIDIPESFIFCMVVLISYFGSTWMVMLLDPDSMNDSTYLSGLSIIKWVSKKAFGAISRTCLTKLGPNEMFSTKWPSMTSRCNQSPPESIALLHSSLRFFQFAASKEGAIILWLKLAICSYYLLHLR